MRELCFVCSRHVHANAFGSGYPIHKQKGSYSAITSNHEIIYLTILFYHDHARSRIATALSVDYVVDMPPWLVQRGSRNGLGTASGRVRRRAHWHGCAKVWQGLNCVAGAALSQVQKIDFGSRSTFARSSSDFVAGAALSRESHGTNNWEWFFIMNVICALVYLDQSVDVMGDFDFEFLLDSGAERFVIMNIQLIFSF